LEKIQIIHEQPLSWDMVTGWISELEALIGARQEREIIQHMQRLAPEFKPVAKGAGDSSEEKLLTAASSRTRLPVPTHDRGEPEKAVKNGKIRPVAPSEQFVPPIAFEH
jgi:hypothetical protein